MRACLLLLLWAAPVGAAPECRLAGRPWLEARGGLRAVDAHLGDAIDVFVAAPGLLGKRRVVFGESGRSRVSWTASGCPEVPIAWRRVEPRMQHESTPAPNKDIKVYANAVVFGPDHGTWIGYDKLEYFETPLEGGGWKRTVRDAAPSFQTERAEPLKPLGTMRLAVTVGELSSPGAEDAPAGLISDRVFRYSFRSGDDALGWLTSFFNVPYLFGSAGLGAKNQAERYLGGDCADVLVAAMRKAGRPLAYSSVAGLVDQLRHQPPPVKPGDLYALDYIGAESLPKAWDHIVMLVEDRGPDGKPDGVPGPEDLVADSGDARGLKFQPLSEQGKVRVQVLR